MTPLLEIKNLKTQFSTEDGDFLAVDNISFELEKGKTLGIVGESGCGKSVTSLSILRLIQKPGKIVGGEVLFKGQDLLKLSDSEMRKYRGSKISMIFQEPMTSLNPVFTVGQQIDEVYAVHFPTLRRAERRERCIDMLKKVGIPAPEKRFDDYPHQLSGGMRQRVMIAIAMACSPELLIADEPTTALDVTIQAQILDLMRNMKNEMGGTLILITHDLGVVAEMCDEVAVMYAGKIIEHGSVDDIFYRPRHPYTRGLLDSIPHFETGKKLESLKTIPGMVPHLLKLPRGCRFQDRCFKVQPTCHEREPHLGTGPHPVACFFPIDSQKTEILHV
jgi:oligopeptide/dipeptide ABC transporter ATP-binding protein